MVTLHLFLLQPGTLISQLQCIFQIAINRTAVASISVNMAIVARILFNITILVRIAVNKGNVHNSCKLYSTVIVVAVNITVEVMVALNIIEYIRYSNCKPHSYCHCSCKHYSLVMDAVKIAVIMIIDYDHDYHRC